MAVYERNKIDEGNLVHNFATVEVKNTGLKGKEQVNVKWNLI
jgi:hypothetical protein